MRDNNQRRAQRVNYIDIQPTVVALLVQDAPRRTHADRKQLIIFHT
jgi:hypothetical protein